MKLDVTVKIEHSDIATAVSWSSEGQLFSCSDDKDIKRWLADGTCQGKVATLSAYPSSLSWYPSAGKQAVDMFAVSCTDGSYRFVSKSGREEKKVQAHEGAVISIQWSHDGSALLTAGEDGDLKVWSKSGNLRTCLASTGQAIYAVCWGPDDDQILFAQGSSLMVKTVQTNKKNLKWSAHDNLVLCVNWNVANGLIVSGGEDCTYRVWDAFGKQLFASRPIDTVITSVAWSPNGESFAVGSFNLLRLCDKTGWTHCQERLQAQSSPTQTTSSSSLSSSGSILDIAWTADGTSFAGAGGDGAVVFAQVVGRQWEWKHVEATVVDSKKIRVRDVGNESVEEIDFTRDRVVELGLGFDHLVVTTTSQCFVYGLQNLNTPIIFDIRAPAHFLHLCATHFASLDVANGLQVINYDGRVLCAPKFQGLRPEYLTRDMVALSPDTVAVVDTVDAKVIQLVDATSGRPLQQPQQGKIVHSAEVVCLKLNQHMLGPQERLLVFCDRNRDLFVVSMHNSNSNNSSGSNSSATVAFKLHSHVESFSFNDETDVLVGFADGRLNVWYSPVVAFTDKSLLPSTMVSTDAADYGRNANIVSYCGNKVTVRKVDGSMMYAATSPDVPLLYELARGERWNECIRLCRHQRNSTLWGALATMAIAKKQLDPAEVALSELNEVAKVEFIQHIKSIPSEEGRAAEMALFRRQPDEAERILLQASPPLVYRAIKLNIVTYRWNRALDIAVKFKQHLDTVLGYRQRYLEDFGKAESNARMLQLASQVTIDWDVIYDKEDQEVANEKKRTGGGGGGRK